MKKGIVLSTILGTLLGGAVSGYTIYQKEEKRVKDNDDKYQKMRNFYHILVSWLELKQNGKSLEEYFVNNNYKSIAIYGMKELGERLLAELTDSKVEVKYVIDKNADKIDADVDAFYPDEDLDPVDVVVVTATYYFDEIYNDLKEYVACPIVSLKEVVEQTK